MKYISLQDLLDYGKELRFQSEEQMAKVYDRMPGIEIVRCKYCIHYRVDDVDGCRYCHIDGRTLEAEDFCSWGERKEE